MAEIIKKYAEYQADIVNLSEESGEINKEVDRYKKQARKYKTDILGLKNFNE